MDSSDAPAGASGATTAAASAALRSNKACRTCAEAKLKCVYTCTDDGAKCDRCERLKKTCQVQMPKPRKRRQPDRARVTQLERRLDTVLQILSASNNVETVQQTLAGDPEAAAAVSAWDAAPAGTPQRMPFRPSSRAEAASASSSAAPPPAQPRRPPPPQNVLSVDTSTSASTTKTYTTSFSTPGSQTSAPPDTPTTSEEERLHIYRTELALNFPFVIIPPNATVDYLRSTKPFLLQTMCLVAEDLLPTLHQDSLRSHLEIMSQRLFLDGEKSLDMLQGILLLLGWNNKLYLLKGQMTNLLQLALALIVDLGLNKTPSAFDREKLATLTTDVTHGERPVPFNRTSEERRALLGYFWLASMTATNHKRLDIPSYTEHMEECRQFLEAECEFPSDLRLVHLVNIQCLVQRVAHTLGTTDVSGTQVPTASVSMCIETFATQLKTMRADLPRQLESDALLQLAIHHAETHIYEIGLLLPYSVSDYSRNILSRQQVLMRCVAAVQNFVEFWIRVPDEAFMVQPVAIWIITSNAIVVVSKLTLFKGPDWDVHSMRQEVDLLQMLGMLIDRVTSLAYKVKLNKVNKEGMSSDVEFWKEHAAKINWLKGWFQKLLQDHATEEEDYGKYGDPNANRDSGATVAADVSNAPAPGVDFNAAQYLAEQPLVPGITSQVWDDEFWQDMTWEPGYQGLPGSMQLGP